MSNTDQTIEQRIDELNTDTSKQLKANTLDEILNKLELAIAGDDAIDCSKAHIEATQAITQAMLDALPEKKPYYQQETERTHREKTYYNKAISEMESAIKKIGGSDE